MLVFGVWLDHHEKGCENRLTYPLTSKSRVKETISGQL